MRFTMKTPMRTFTLLSLGLISLMVLGVGFAQTAFYRDAMLQREGNDIRDVAEAVASQHLFLKDMDNFENADAQRRFEKSFAALINLSETVNIRVYNLRHEIVWSDNPYIIGNRLDADHEIESALAGENVISFYSTEGNFRHHDYLPEIPLVEFHVPLYVKNEATGNPQVGGMFALFRSTQTLNEILDSGATLIWTVTGFGGMVLYVALAGLFWSVYRRQQETELQVSELITEQQKHQRIVQMEKLSAIGMMIGEIAHQINNPLVGVVNMAQLAEREADDPERTRELLGEIRKAGEHCRVFLQRMLTFTTISRYDRKPTEMKGLISETIELFQQSAEKHPQMITEFPDSEVILDVDPILIRHALFNLLSNAAQADPTGGAITVGLRPKTRAEDQATGWSLSVRDQGPGVAEDVQDKIFTPFFSTRPDGTGLGLSVVQQVAMIHEGQITATNDPDGGANFALWLPDST